MTAPASPSTRRLTPEDFEFGDLLGEGAYAKVCLATLISSNTKYAVKVVDKHFITRHNKQASVMTEKQVLSMLRHENVIKLHHTFQDQDSLYFVLELAPGGELFSLIKKFGRLPEPLAAHLAAELAQALSYMHEKGVWHRDVKTENILLSAEGHVKLTDFGTAKITAAQPAQSATEDSDQEPPRKNSFVGTAEYVAPEILRNEAAGPASDLWSFGCVLFHMLVGRPPFRGQSEYLTFQLILNRQFEYPTFVSDAARDLIDSLLKLDPTERLSWSSVLSHSFFANTPISSLATTSPPHYHDEPQPELLSESELQIEQNVDSLAAAQKMMNNAAAMQKKNDELIASTLDRNPAISESLADAAAPIAMRNSLAPVYSPWRKFLQNGEEILYTELLEKGRGIFSKRRQLILTTVPRFLYVDVAKMELKGEIQWEPELSVEVKDAKHFVVQTPSIDRSWYFECLGSEGASAWAEIINQLKSRP